MAQLSGPTGVCLDKYGNIYIADLGNDKVRKVDATTGIITTIAGTGTLGYSGDGGPATAAEMNGPGQVVVDTMENVYIVDADNNVVRKINGITGIISTIAGNGTAGYASDTGLATNAELNTPTGVHLDSAGNIFIADWLNGAIRRVNAITGIITTVAGTGTQGFSGDGGPATAAQLRCHDLCFDSHGNMIIADYNNMRVREVVNHPLNQNEILNREDQIKIFPNPTTGTITITNAQNQELTLTNILGEKLVHFTAPEKKQLIDLSNYPNGIYILDLSNPQTGRKIVKRLVKE